ncbi:hypothetical protein SBADM41S_01139 [Streptomyces badius]
MLSASNFESFPSAPWTITEQPPTVPPGTTLMDTLPLINGSARSEANLSPEGTYQLVWVVPAGPKQRSFKVECDRGNHGSKPHEPQQPIGGVPAGGGGVPGMEPVGSESDSNAGTSRGAGCRGCGRRRPDHDAPVRTAPCPWRGVTLAAEGDDEGRRARAVSR